MKTVKKCKYVAPIKPGHERIDEYKLTTRRTLRKGQVCKIHGQRGGMFEFLYATKHSATGIVQLTFVGGKSGHRLERTFLPDRVGAFVGRAS